MILSNCPNCDLDYLLSCKCSSKQIQKAFKNQSTIS